MAIYVKSHRRGKAIVKAHSREGKVGVTARMRSRLSKAYDRVSTKMRYATDMGYTRPEGSPSRARYFKKADRYRKALKNISRIRRKWSAL